MNSKHISQKKSCSWAVATAWEETEDHCKWGVWGRQQQDTWRCDWYSNKVRERNALLPDQCCFMLYLYKKKKNYSSRIWYFFRIFTVFQMTLAQSRGRWRALSLIQWGTILYKTHTGCKMHVVLSVQRRCCLPHRPDIETPSPAVHSVFT